MSKRILIIAVLIFSLAANVQAQSYSTTNKKAIRQYEQAINLYAANPAGALSAIEQALQYDPSFAEALMTAGDMCMEQRLYDKAEDYYKRFIQSDKKHRSWREEAQHSLDCIAFRRDAVAHPVNFTPKNMGPNVNSKDDEYLPAVTIDGRTLIFTRRFPRTQHTTANTPMEEDFYSCALSSEGEWQRAQRMGEPLNSTDNEGAQCISQDGRIMFFTACERPTGRGRCDIYMCIHRSKGWSRPLDLGINTGGWESQPSFSIDGKTLYFVSDRSGGYGGLDIWKTTFSEGHWTTPVNLGPEINTAEDEQSPYIHYDDQSLYFSSKGHTGMGGFDLFVSRRQPDGSWGKPQNLGYPINTESDEQGLIVSPDGHTALMASDRLGGYGGQDLFSFDLPSTVRPLATVCLIGHVSDALTSKPVASTIQVIDLASGQPVAVTSSDSLTGTYMASMPANCHYAVNVEAKGYLFHSASYDLLEGASSAADTLDIALSPISQGQTLHLNNIYFATAQSELLPESHVELDHVVELLTKNPTLRILISGHTDNVGTEADNLTLSEARAQAVYDYLVAHGIAANRLTHKGYGESRPIADNATEQGRQLNRRTDLTIL